MSAGYELDIRGREALNDYQNQNQGIGTGNCQQSLGCTPYNPYWIAPPCTCPSLGDYEISIQQISATTEPLLNYGAKLRLVIADPYKGIDLREAIAKLKLALKECIK